MYILLQLVSKYYAIQRMLLSIVGNVELVDIRCADCNCIRVCIIRMYVVVLQLIVPNEVSQIRNIFTLFKQGLLTHTHWPLTARCYSESFPEKMSVHLHCNIPTYIHTQRQTVILSGIRILLSYVHLMFNVDTSAQIPTVLNTIICSSVYLYTYTDVQSYIFRVLYQSVLRTCIHDTLHTYTDIYVHTAVQVYVYNTFIQLHIHMYINGCGQIYINTCNLRTKLTLIYSQYTYLHISYNHVPYQNCIDTYVCTYTCLYMHIQM